MAVGLDRERPDTSVAQHLAQQLEPLREPGAHDYPVRRGDHAAGARDIFGDRHPQHFKTARVGIAQVASRCRCQCPASGREPGRARKQGQIGGAGPQVIARTATGPLSRWGRTRRRRSSALGDPRAGTVPGCQPALGNELAVGLGDGVAGDAQIQCERAGRGQRGARRQPAAADSVTQRALEGGPWPGARQLEVKVKTGGSGPRSLHRIGS